MTTPLDPRGPASGAVLGDHPGLEPGSVSVYAERLRLAAAASDPEAAAALDVQALTELRDDPAVDAVLEGLDLESLAALGARCSARLPDDPPLPARETAWDFLDLVRRRPVLRKIAASGTVAAWAQRILDLVDRSHLTAGVLFHRRVEMYGSKILFELAGTGPGRSMSWRHAGGRVDAIARGLVALLGPGASHRVAILSDNRIETALADLACLSTEFVPIMVPANATEADVAAMLRHSKATAVIAGSHDQLAKVLANRGTLPDLVHVIQVDPGPAVRDVVSLDDVVARAGSVPAAEVLRRARAARSGDLATVMYTSGTTGRPKGIRFAHRNIVFKRFARALALPEIGEDDVFLCYLPLYHTFGRFFEMWGCVFWGATYCFVEDPSVEALVQGMRRHRPTVFISVPKKWLQLHEAIALEAPPDKASDDDILEAARSVTGGRLRWGLSAAGYLPADVFRFFQAVGVELMSGFGMTEATGGITMTPPGAYRDDSLGLPLPGIEVRLDADGEMLVRGPYVMMGYLEPFPGEIDLDAEGWFRTGDLMERDAEGFLRLVDRKKEIYKNVKGETIAPQRIESLFHEFESVGRAFVVGDHREYNTVILWPNRDAAHVDLSAMNEEERSAHFRSIVASVNAFLAPYERVVDFAVVDRELDPEAGELTPKGTLRRRAIEGAFAETVRLLYRRARFRLGGADLVFPNWLFQALGLTAQDLRVDGDRLVLPGGKTLHVRRLQEGIVQIGSCVYAHRPGPVLLGVFVTTPRLWLGNDELVAFASVDLKLRQRPGRASEGIAWRGRVAPFRPGVEDDEALEVASSHHDLGLMDLHQAALHLASPVEEGAVVAVHLLARVLAQDEGPLAEPARHLLARAAASPSLEVRRRAFRAVVPAERDPRFASTLNLFLATPGVVLDADTRAALCEQSLSEVKLDAFLAAADEAARPESVARGAERRLSSLLRFIAAYGAVHHAQYRKLRGALVRLMTFAGRASARQEAARAVEDLQRGFRTWLGPNERVGSDPETGHEYRWDDVIAFEDGVPEADRERLVAAIRQTALLREAVFLFSRGAMPRLLDIPPGGVWIRPLDERHGVRVYRITIQTRYHGTYDIAVNVAQGLTYDVIREQTTCLLLCGATPGRDPLVQEFGGYWRDHGLWSEEFVSGESLDRTLRRLARRLDPERFRQSWVYFAWSALAAFFEFWDRTGRRVEIGDPSLGNVIVPSSDFQTGARIVSVADTKPHRSLAATLRFLRDDVIAPVETLYPALAGEADWPIILSSLLEAVGEAEGLRMLRELVHRDGAPLPADLADALRAFVRTTEDTGFVPMRLYSAIQRYLRWERLTVEPTPEARARMLQELWDTYGLARVASGRPDVRARFFRETVFRDAPAPLARGLDDTIAHLRRHDIESEALIDAVTDLRAHIDLGPDEDYFLARLSLPYLRPEDAAVFVQAATGGRHQSEIVVTLEDADGNPFRVRHALMANEVGRLHRLFLSANLDVRFRPEHNYLVAVGDRQQIIGGIFYEIEDQGRSAHLDKIVVAERFRRKGVADGLLKEFFNRLRAIGVRTVTTGFFRPEYFYGHGFKIEKRYAGLVKSLENESRASAT